MDKDTLSHIASPDSDDDSVDMFSKKREASNSQYKFKPLARSVSPPVSPIPIFNRIGNLPKRATNDTMETEISARRSNDQERKNIIKMSPVENPYSQKDASSFRNIDYDNAPQFFMSKRQQMQQPQSYSSPYMTNDNMGYVRGGQAVHHFHHSATPMINPNMYMHQMHPTTQQHHCCEHSAAALNKKSNRPNYALLNEDETREMKAQFVKKLLILKTVVPKWNIMIPSDSSSLNYFHDIYELYSKQITVYINTFYFKIGLCFMFIILQWAMGLAGVSMEGYAMSQINSINNYDCLLMELSEKYMSSGTGEPMSVEQRFIYFAAIQALAFMFCNYIEKMTGSKSLAEYMRTFISTNVADKLKEREEVDPTAGLDNVGVPLVPGLEDQLKNVSTNNTPEPKQQPAQQQNNIMDIGKLIGSVSGLLSGGAGDVNGNLANTFGGIMNVLGAMNGGGNTSVPKTPISPKSPGPPRSRPSIPLSPTSQAPTSPPKSARRRPVFNRDPNSTND